MLRGLLLRLDSGVQSMSKNEDSIHTETSRGHQPIYTGVQALPPRRIRIIGVPLDLGQQRRGVDMGPSAVRVAGLEAHLEALGHVVTDGGNISVAIAETKSPGDENARYLKEIRETCVKAADLVVKTLEEGSTPVILGGDHSVAAGSVSGVAEFYRRKGQKIGLIWIDAHSDINTPETSPSGNVHGMPMAALLGLGPKELSDIYDFSPKVQPDNVVLIGVRDIDATEPQQCRCGSGGYSRPGPFRNCGVAGCRFSMKAAKSTRCPFVRCARLSSAG